MAWTDPARPRASKVHDSPDGGVKVRAAQAARQPHVAPSLMIGMAAGKRPTPLPPDELTRPFAGEWGDHFPPILSPTQLAALLGLSPKTVYEWIAKGRLDGSFRKRGKHVLIWRDRALHVLFNGKDWT